ncbi:MAG: cyclic nucleotide-binding domain-containing protein [Elusimicrobiota bacterium]
MKISENEMLNLIRTLRKLEFFAGFTSAEVDTVLSTVDKKSYRKGEIIIKQGDHGRFFFIINSGKVAVFINNERKSNVKIGELGAGDYFGETSLITHSPVGATVKAEENTEAFVLYKSDIELVIKKNPSAAQHMKETIERRKEMTSYEINRSPEKKNFFAKFYGLFKK